MEVAVGPIRRTTGTATCSRREMPALAVFNDDNKKIHTNTGQGAPWPMRRRDAGEGRASKGEGESEK